MATREKAPNGPTAKAKEGQRWGALQWNARLDADGALRVATDCGTIDENGVRHIKWRKNGNPDDEGMFASNYEASGYTVVDDGTHFDFQIKDSEYQIKRAAQQRAIDERDRPKGRRKVRDAGVPVDDVYELEAPISSKDLLGLGDAEEQP